MSVLYPQAIIMKMFIKFIHKAYLLQKIMNIGCANKALKHFKGVVAYNGMCIGCTSNAGQGRLKPLGKQH